MRGCRPLSCEEVGRVAAAFEGPTRQRDRTLFLLGVNIGARITELLSLRVGDVRAGGVVASEVYFQRRNVKGRRAGRRVPVNEAARRVLAEYVATRPGAPPWTPLFPSRIVGRALSRFRAHVILQRAYAKAGVFGKVAWHSTRKFFATEIEKGGARLSIIKDLLGHASISTTERYLGVDSSEAQAAVAALGALGGAWKGGQSDVA